MLVTTLDGRVHAVDLEAGTTEVVLDISDHVSTGGERGLLGIAIDPDGERIYLDYTGPGGDTEIRSWALGADGLPEAGDGRAPPRDRAAVREPQRRQPRVRARRRALDRHR